VGRQLAERLTRLARLVLPALLALVLAEPLRTAEPPNPARDSTATHPVAVEPPTKVPHRQVLVPQAAPASRTPEMPKKIPVAMLDGSCVWVDDKDAAALAGLAKLPYGRKEFAGAIYQREDGKFCYSDAVPGTMDNFEFATDPKAGKFAGLYHTHHGGQEGEFSPTDVKVADALRKTSYIRGNESGDVRRYDPGVDQLRRSGGARSSVAAPQKAAGTLIGNLSRRDQIEAAYDLHNPETKK
jgi:hypothetical protein